MKKANKHIVEVSQSKLPALAQSQTQIKYEGLIEALTIIQMAQRAAPWLK